MCVCVCVCVCKDEKIGLQEMILFVEIFAYVKRLGVKNFNKASKLLNETKGMRKFRKSLQKLKLFRFI